MQQGPLGQGTGPLGLKTAKDEELDFLEKSGLVTKKDVERRREDERAYNADRANPKAKAREKLDQKRRALPGKPAMSFAEARKRTPGTWENSVAKARAGLKLKPGSEDDALLKSLLWLYGTDNYDGKGMRLNEKDYLEAVKLFKTDKDTARARVEAYRAAVERRKENPTPPIDQGGPTPSYIKADQFMQETGLAKMRENVDATAEKINKTLGTEKLGGAARWIIENGPILNVANAMTSGAVADVADQMATGIVGESMVTPGRLLPNFLKFVNVLSGEVPVDEAGFAAIELTMDIASLAGYAELPAGVAKLVEFLKSGKAAAALTEAGVKEADEVVKSVAKVIDDLPDGEAQKILDEAVNRPVGAEFRTPVEQPGTQAASDLPEQASQAMPETPAPSVNLHESLKGNESVIASAVEKAKARKAARQARRESGEINLASGFDPEIIYDAVDDAIIYVGDKAIPIEQAIRAALKDNGLGDEAFGEVEKQVKASFNLTDAKDAGFEVRNSAIDAIRESMGKDPLTSRYVPDDVTMGKAVDLRGTEPQIISDVLSTSKKIPSDAEVVAIGSYMDGLLEELPKVDALIEQGDEAAIIRRNQIDAEIERAQQALRKAGSEAAAALGIRARRFNWENGSLKAQFVAKVGRAPNEQELKLIDQLTKERDNALAEVKKLQSQGTRQRIDRSTQQPRVQRLLNQAEADLSAWKAKREARANSGEIRLSSVMDPEILEGAYLYAKVGLLRGLRTFDEIYQSMIEGGLQIDEESAARMIEKADLDTRKPTKKQVGPTLTTLRKELKAKLKEQPDVVQELLDEADKLAKTKIEELDPKKFNDFVERAGKVVRKLNPGKSQNFEFLQYGKNAIEDPRIAQARGRARIAATKAKELADDAARKAEFEAKSAAGKVFSTIGKGVMSSRQIITGPDVSFGGRQGFIAMFMQPKEWLKMQGANVGSFVSADYAKAVEEFVAGHPMLDDALNAGLDVNVGSGAFEEDLAKMLDKVWGYKQSQRAYQNSANKLRLDLYEGMVTPEMTVEGRKVIADFVNIVTGRSSQNLGNAGKYANALMFAPRYLMSRLEFVTGTPMIKAIKSGDKAAMKVVAKEYGKFIAGFGAIATGLAMGQDKLGYTIDLDPRSSKFMMLKTKDGLEFDMSGGLSGYIRPVAAGFTTLLKAGGQVGKDAGVPGVAKLAKMPVATGPKTDHTDPMTFLSWWFRGRLSPVVTSFATLASANAKGELKSFGAPTNAAEVGLRAFIQIYLQNLAETYAKGGSAEEMLAQFLLEFFGGGVEYKSDQQLKQPVIPSVVSRARSGQ